MLYFFIQNKSRFSGISCSVKANCQCRTTYHADIVPQNKRNLVYFGLEQWMKHSVCVYLPKFIDFLISCSKWRCSCNTVNSEELQSFLFHAERHVDGVCLLFLLSARKNFIAALFFWGGLSSAYCCLRLLFCNGSLSFNGPHISAC